MKLTCPITGIVTIPASIFDATNLRIPAPHPMLLASKTALDKLYNKTANISDRELAILFCVYLYKTGLLTYHKPLSPKLIFPELASRYMELIMKLASLPEDRKENLPGLAIDTETTAQELERYLARLELAMLDRLGLLQLDTSASQDMLENELLERKRARAAISAAKKRRERSLATIKAWAMLALDGQITAIVATTVESIITNPSLYTVSGIKEVKYLCLDNLPETAHADSIKKAELIQYLDKVITEKLELKILLADSQEELNNYRTELEEIDSSYAIVYGDSIHSNSAIPVAKKVADLLDSTTLEYKALPETETKTATETEEPVESNYKNRMAYIIAMRKWQTVQSTSK